VSNGTPLERRARIARAQGMVTVQAECTMDEALDLMRDRAAVGGQTLEEIADAVIDRSIRFGE
jgi:AmiR/NasT family two-component response regulator